MCSPPLSELEVLPLVQVLTSTLSAILVGSIVLMKKTTDAGNKISVDTLVELLNTLCSLPTVQQCLSKLTIGTATQLLSELSQVLSEQVRMDSANSSGKKHDSED